MCYIIFRRVLLEKSHVSKLFPKNKMGTICSSWTYLISAEGIKLVKQNMLNQSDTFKRGCYSSSSFEEREWHFFQ